MTPEEYAARQRLIQALLEQERLREEGMDQYNQAPAQGNTRAGRSVIANPWGALATGIDRGMGRRQARRAGEAASGIQDQIQPMNAEMVRALMAEELRKKQQQPGGGYVPQGLPGNAPAPYGTVR